MSKIDCSIVFPLLNEEDNIVPAYEKICEIMKKAEVSYEIIFVDDGSTDNSKTVIEGLCEKDTNVKMISFSRNFGQYPAIMAGFRASVGGCAINLDIDLQDDPNIIPEMIKKWQEGYEIVTIKRRKRKEGLIKRLTAKMYYHLMKKLGQKDIEGMAIFSLVGRKALNELCALPDTNFYPRTHINNLGFKKTSLYADRQPRERGKTKYNIRKLTSIAMKSVVSSTTKPLFWSFGISAALFCSFMLSLILFIVLAACGVSFSTALWLIPIIALCFSLTTLCIGFVGMYLAFTYNQVRGNPLYIIKETKNLENSILEEK